MESLGKATKKLGSSFLAFCLAISMMPMNVFAETTSTVPSKVEISASEEIKVSPNGTNYYVIDSNKENTFKLSAKVSPDEVSQDVTWASDKTANDITIDDEGKVTVGYTGENPVYATFTATSKESASVKATYSIYILTPMVWDGPDSVEITLPEDGTMPEEDEYFSTDPYQYENYKIVEWTSQDTNIATVRSNGTVCFVVGVRPGKTTVVGQNKAVKENSLIGNVTVKGVAVEAKDGSKSAKLLKDGSIDLVAYGEKEDSQFTWSSSDEEVATVDNNGKVTTLKEGSTLITATDENGAKGGFKINVKRSENAPYLENLELMNYTTFKDWTSYTSNFGTSKLNYKLETKNASTSNVTVRLKASYDESKYKVDVLKDGELYKTYEKTATEIAPPVEPGDSQIVIRVTDLNDKDNYTDYTFDVTRTRNTAATLSGATVVPGNKAVNTILLYKGKAEGTLFRLNASTGDVTTTSGFSASVYGYRSYLFNDADSFVLTPKLSDSYGKLRMSIDGGEMVDIASGKALDPIKFGDKNTVEVKLFGCSDATYYANQQAGKEDPFEVESTYTITVERTSIDNNVLDKVKIVSADISNGVWCTPKFDKNLSSAAVLVDADCTSLDINFTLKEGVKAYSSTTMSDKNLINPNEDGTYTLNIVPGKNGTVKLAYNLEDGSQLVNTYTFITYKKGKLSGMPDKITDYLCPGSQYSNMYTYGMYPEKSLTGSGSWSTPISLGNFGGEITYYYDKAIKNDPSNPYGIDFTVFGNSNGGQSFSEPGNVIVSEDGENWYTLAGSEHYDEHAIWGYELTYIRNGSGTACSYKDSLGGSADMTTMYKFPLKENYPLHKFNEDADKQITVSGTLLVNDTKDPYGSSSALYPDFGYVDVHTNSSTVAGTGENVDLLTVPVGNPYTGSYNKYGDGFDLDWAVDEDGYPVKLDEIHYVKVQTASFIMAGAIGEKSTEVNCVTRTFGENEVGKTTAPTSITVGDKTIELKEGVDTYSVDFPENFDVTVNTSEDANVYINSQRGTTRTYTAAPEKGIIRIIVQEGEKEPAIYYLTNKKEAKTTVTFDADNGQDVVVKEVAEDGSLDYIPENPTKKDYTFVGWYKDTDDITTAYESNQNYTESATYKAKWAHVNMLGAQAKAVVNNKSGIRFGTKLYTDGDKVVEKGTLIIPSNLLNGEALTLDTAKAAKSIAKVNYEEKEDYTIYLGTIVNMPQSQFNRAMTATAYVTYQDNAGNEYTVYAPYQRGSVTINELLEGFM